jgi:hypothetical protein
MASGNNSDAVLGFIMGQTAGQQAATSAGIEASSARSAATAAQMRADVAARAARGAGEQADQAIMVVGMLRAQVDAWKARYDREKAARRGWQQNGMAARELIQKLANVDRDGAQKLIDQAYEDNKTKIDASKTKVDEWQFTGVEPGKH